MPEQTIYGDGHNKVVVDEDTVVLSNHDDDGEPDSVVVFSHAAFREVALGWERHELKEKE